MGMVPHSRTLEIKAALSIKIQVMGGKITENLEFKSPGCGIKILDTPKLGLLVRTCCPNKWEADI